MLDKVENATDNFVLLITVISETITVYVNMQTAGACLMRTIAKIYSVVHNIFPTEIFVIFKSHRVTYKFHSVIKRAISFDVDMLVVLIGNIKNFFCIVIVLACFVDFKLNTEESCAVAFGIFTKEFRFRFVAVLVD